MLKSIPFAIVGVLVAEVAMAADEHPYYDTTGKFAGSYLCIADAAGGVFWNETSKSWVGTTFNVKNRRTILKVESLGPKDSFYEGATYKAISYVVSLGAFGTDRNLQCDFDGGFKTDPSKGAMFISNKGYMWCKNPMGDYQFNLSTLRYLETYPRGFISGKDSNDDTPSVTIGTCSKL